MLYNELKKWEYSIQTVLLIVLRQRTKMDFLTEDNSWVGWDLAGTWGNFGLEKRKSSSEKVHFWGNPSVKVSKTRLKNSSMLLLLIFRENWLVSFCYNSNFEQTSCNSTTPWNTAIPSIVMPSDHIAVVVDVSFRWAFYSFELGNICDNYYWLPVSFDKKFLYL